MIYMYLESYKFMYWWYIINLMHKSWMKKSVNIDIKMNPNRAPVSWINSHHCYFLNEWLFISSGVVGPPPFPPATSSLSGFTASAGIQGYYQPPHSQYGTNQAEPMQVTGNSSEVKKIFNRIPGKNIMSVRCAFLTRFSCIHIGEVHTAWILFFIIHEKYSKCWTQPFFGQIFNVGYLFCLDKFTYSCKVRNFFLS